MDKQTYKAYCRKIRLGGTLPANTHWQVLSHLNSLKNPTSQFIVRDVGKGEYLGADSWQELIAIVRSSTAYKLIVYRNADECYRALMRFAGNWYVGKDRAMELWRG